MTTLTLTPDELTVLEQYKAKIQSEKEAAALECIKMQRAAVDFAQSSIDNDIKTLDEKSAVLRKFFELADKQFPGQFSISTETVKLSRIPYFYNRTLPDSPRTELDKISVSHEITVVTYLTHNVRLDVAWKGTCRNGEYMVTLNNVVSNFKSTYYKNPDTWKKRIDEYYKRKQEELTKEQRKLAEQQIAVEYFKSLYPNSEVTAEMLYSYNHYGYKRNYGDYYPIIKIKINKDTLSMYYTVDKNNTVSSYSIAEYYTDSDTKKSIKKAQEDIVLNYFKSL